MYRFSRFSAFASRVARLLSHPATFGIVLVAALLWLASGPLFHFSGNWYSAYSNAATIVTTLLLFLIQHTQSREMASVQLKLNEIIRISEGAHNALLDIEELTDRDYDQIKASYTLLAQQARGQLRDGKLKWATARVSMESFDSLLDPSVLKHEDLKDVDLKAEKDLEETSAEPVTTQPDRPWNTTPTRLAPSLDRMTRIAAHSGHAPMALIALNAEDYDGLQRQVGFAEVADGVDDQERTLLAKFLIAQVAASRHPLVVADSYEQPLPVDTGGVPIAAFLALPLIAAPHEVIGCLAVLDVQPRPWRDTEIAALQDLAALTVDQIIEQTLAVSTPVETQTGAGAIAVPVTSPASSASVTAQGENREAAESAEIPGKDVPAGTILVVDDSETNRTLMRRRLEREGYRVVVAGDGQAALDCLQTESVGLILLDVMMPGMDGEEVLQHMQTDDRFKEIPVIMVTALDEQASVERCLQAGAKDYILKPIDPTQLRARVHVYLPPVSDTAA